MGRALLKIAITMMLCASLFSQAQQNVVNSNTVVPSFVKFSATLTDVNAKPLSGTVGVTFLLYKDEQGGAPLWMETQNITPDKTGHYTVVLGSTTNQGLPTDLFASGEARWLAVQAEGQAEQPRVLLLSVPYALKAGDAQTLGGMPASAFMPAAPGASKAAAASSIVSAAPSSAAAPPPASSNVTTTGGTANTIPLFTTGTNIQNSILTQTGTTTVNVAGKLNLPATGVATSAGGKNSQPQDFAASAYNSATKAAVAQTFQFQAEAAGNNTATPTGTLNLLYGSGTTAPAETGMRISNKGLITFAAGQTFPGTGSGTVKSVASGAGLTGGPITTTGTLSIANTGVTNAMLAHPSLTITPGTALTGGGAVALGGITTLNVDTTKIPQLNVANTFTGNQTIKGNLNDTGNISATGSVTGQTANFTANNTTQVVNVTQSGSGSGIVTTSATSTSTPAILAKVTNATNGVGVAGEVAGTQGIGVLGFASSTAVGASGLGVEGASAAPNGAGVFGFSQDSTGAGMGVYASSSSPSGVGARGVWSTISTIGSAIADAGVWGDSANGKGVVGTSDTSTGVSGLSSSNYGVNGTSSSSYGTVGVSYNYVGVIGATVDSSIAGVLGLYEDVGSGSGSGLSQIGVWGDTGVSGGFGVLGTTDDGNSLFGVNNTVNHETLYVENDSGFNGGTPLAARFAGPGASTYCYIPRDSADNGSGDLVCTGTKSAAVPVGGNHMVRLYAVEAADNWFEDAGSGQLANGAAAVALDVVFAQTVNGDLDYHVFITPNGDCEGLYVTNKTGHGFEVHELHGGHSNIAFDYRVMARRRGFENVRMQDVTADFAQMKRASDLIAARREAGKARPKLQRPTLPKRPPSTAPSARNLAAELPLSVAPAASRSK